MEIDQLYVYANHICSKILQIVPDIKNLGVYSNTSSTMETMLVDLINFFKSYTVDMINLKIVYVLDLKPQTLLRLIDWIHYKKINQYHDIFPLSYSDNLSFIARDIYKDAFLLRFVLTDLEGYIRLDNDRKKEELLLEDTIKSVSDSLLTLREHLAVIDIPYVNKLIAIHEETLALQDAVKIIEKDGFEEDE